MGKTDYSYINDDNYTDYIKPLNKKVKEDLSGNVYGEWEVKGYFGNKLWLCRCSCGKYNAMMRYFLVNRKSKSCGHDMINDLSDTQIGEWYVIRYLGNQHYECRCSCGKIKSVHSYSLTSRRSTSCGHSAKADLYIGNKYWDWEVIDYCDNDNKYICKCSCGTLKKLDIYSVTSGRSKSCGHNSNAFKNIKDQVFGELTALEYIGDGKWKCKCSCKKVVEVHGSALRLGRVTSCGHINKKVKDIKNQKIGKWTVKDYIGNMLWRCECECGEIGSIYGHALRSGRSSSCTKCSRKKSKQTLLDRYGDVTPSKIKNPREQWQIDIVSSPDKLKQFILNLEETPTIFDLQCMLNINKSNTLEYIHRYNLEDLVRINSTESHMEVELLNYIKSIYSKEVLHGDRTILDGIELDIYIPEKKIAIEFNGNYWHSDELKDKYYHQKKTLDCARNGIHLIHIFEYEWLDSVKKVKILSYLRKLLDKDYINVIYARSTFLKQLNNRDVKEFIDRYHLQGYTPASINIGMYYKDELVSVISFGKPRFSNDAQYEILRYCNKDDIIVIGGLEKMFKYFKDIYNPESIITYSDLSKFSGNCYLKLGFRTNFSMITEPNYVWVSSDKKEVLSRYKCQKHKLIEQGLGGLGSTESEIMKELRFLRIYDSGNLRLEWNRQ